MTQIFDEKINELNYRNIQINNKIILIGWGFFWSEPHIIQKIQELFIV